MTQFPYEIQLELLSYLEPLWVIQLAEAYEVVDQILRSDAFNIFWYRLMPPHLMTEPESFQLEMVQYSTATDKRSLPARKYPLASFPQLDDFSVHDDTRSDTIRSPTTP